ncbi:MAG: methyltransferase [Actinobacteria bacterium]|nr:methyltransferase [Actinomycetota bacterium]
MENDGVRTTTKNADLSREQILALLNTGFANFLVESRDGSISLRITKKGEAQVHYEKGEFVQNLEHDRKKNRLLEPSDPFLIEVGISDSKGVVKPSRQDKFKQVEEFLRLLAPTVDSAISAGQLPAPTESKPLNIVDLGCGHAYLTFAAHQYLRSTDRPVHVIGIDIREESRARNEKIAMALGISESIEFRAQEIAATTKTNVDVAIALHACDTATDDALAWAVKNGAGLILAAPCCHHDIQRQMDAIPEPWSMVTKQGILKERLGDILTDAIRCQILRLLGYRVEAIEFIGGEHTPRNLMIRAVKTGVAAQRADIDRYVLLIEQWQLSPYLATVLKAELSLVLT